MSNAILGEIPHIDRLERLSPVCKGRHTPCALTLACCGRDGVTICHMSPLPPSSLGWLNVSGIVMRPCALVRGWRCHEVDATRGARVLQCVHLWCY